MLGAWDGAVGDDDALGDVEALDGATLAVALAVDPDFAVVVDAGLKEDADTLDGVAFHGVGRVTLMRYQPKVKPRDWRAVRSEHTSQLESSYSGRRAGLPVDCSSRPSLGSPGT